MKTSAGKGPKLDLKKELKSLYGAKAGVIASVNPGAHRFLCADGRGDPNTSPAYRAAVEALFSVSYTLKFALRRARGVDHAVMPLEGAATGGHPETALIGQTRVLRNSGWTP